MRSRSNNKILSVQHWGHETGEGITAAGSRADIYLRKGNPSVRYGPVVVIVPQDGQGWAARATGEVPQIREALYESLAFRSDRSHARSYGPTVTTPFRNPIRIAASASGITKECSCYVSLLVQNKAQSTRSLESSWRTSYRLPQPSRPSSRRTQRSRTIRNRFHPRTPHETP